MSALLMQQQDYHHARRQSHISTESPHHLANSHARVKPSASQESAALLSHFDPELGFGAKKRLDLNFQEYLVQIWKKFRDGIRNLYRKLGLEHLFPLCLVAVYSLLGAVMFQATERQNDIETKRDKALLMDAQRRQAMLRVEEIIEDPAYRKVQGRIFDEVQKVFEYYDKQYCEIYGYCPSTDTVWTFWNAMYYAGTLYTTIGYGNIAPSTRAGQLCTIFYSIIGIPLMLVTLNDLGKFLFDLILKVLTMCNRHVRRRWVTLRKSFNKHQSPSVHEELENKTNELKSRGFSIDSMDEETEKVDSDDTVRRIPVSVALGVTIGWIFLCAALFCIWERSWSYFTSVYFVYISLSTIGLGDVTPEFPEYMIAIFYLVIIGLSLVTMSINVVQARIEDLFLQLLMRMLAEYQNQMAGGNDQVGAAVGMAQMWSTNKAAKYLMPLIGASKKQAVVQKFHEEAKAQGIEIPPILQEINPESGLPAIIQIVQEHKDQAGKSELANELQKGIHQAETNALQTASVLIDKIKSQMIDSGIQSEPGMWIAEPVKNAENFVQTDINLTDKAVETEKIKSEEKLSQTSVLEQRDATSSCRNSMEFASIEIQTVSEHYDKSAQVILEENCENFKSLCENEAQTDILLEYTTAETQTKLTVVERETQTRTITITESEVQATKDIAEGITQSESSVFQLVESEMGTDSCTIDEHETQTDPIPKPTPSFLSSSKKSKIQRKSLSPEVGKYEEEKGAAVAAEESDEEKDLVWDPKDGMHAEKQKPLKHLKKMFEMGNVPKEPEKPQTSTLRRTQTQKSAKP